VHVRSREGIDLMTSGAVRLQGAAVVLDGDPGDPPDNPVGDHRGDLRVIQLVLPLVPPPADDVVPSLILSRNFRDVGRVRSGGAPSIVIRSSRRAWSIPAASGRLPVVPRNFDHPEALVPPRKFAPCGTSRPCFPSSTKRISYSIPADRARRRSHRAGGPTLSSR